MTALQSSLEANGGAAAASPDLVKRLVETGGALDGMTPSERNADAAVKVFTAPDGRKTVLALAFLIFLPFLLSVPIMFLKRTAHGLWIDALSAGVIGAALLAWTWFLFREVMSAIRIKIIVGRRKVRLRIPRYRSANPDHEILRLQVRYESIDRVETREEVFTALKVPVVTRVTALVLKDGRRIVLGYQNEGTEDPDIDYPTVGALIAERAGVEFHDRGKVFRGSHLAAYRNAKAGAQWDEHQMTEDEYNKLKRQKRLLLLAMTVGVLALFAAGFLYDLSRSNAVQSFLGAL